MSGLELLIVQLAPAISKILLAIWLKDPSLSPNFTADATSDIIDVIRSKTSDILAQRRAARQFIEIGERIAESLEPIITHEANSIDENSKKAIILGLADVINMAGIDEELLSRQDYNQNILLNHLYSYSENIEKHFSADEDWLFRRLASETAQTIIDISGKLPRFTEKSLVEILRRETKILDIANEALETIRTIKDASKHLNTDQNSQLFESEYRRQIDRQLGRMQLIGIEASIPSTKYGLIEAYVALNAYDPSSYEYEDEGMTFEYISTSQLLATQKALLLIGDPGSGKTTFLQWIAVNAATNHFPPDLKQLNNKIPFFIRLREYANSTLPEPQDFVRHTTPMIADEMPRGWVHSILRSGRGMLLIDGVDELPEDQRDEVQDWINGLVEAFPFTTFAVTSRPYAVNYDWLEKNDFSIAELQSMDLPTIYEFVHQWHQAVYEELSSATEKEAMKEFEQGLRSTLKTDKAIRSLATNPLLCAMICALNRDSQQHLPTRRTVLYNAACRMLITERDKRRKITLNHPELDYEQKRTLLQKLAYWMLRNKKPQATREEAEHVFSKVLSTLQSSKSTFSSPQIYDMFVERSGIVQETENNVLNFIHRTFLEYLAAVEIIDERDIGVLTSYATDEQWREVIILASGIADNKGRNEIITNLVKRGDKEKDHGPALHLLAATCLEATVTIEPNVKQSVERRLQELVPPKSAIAARALASAGELAAPYLKWKSDYTEDEAIFGIRALAEAKTAIDSALDILSTYTNDKRRKVIIQLCKTWKMFEPEEFANTILAKMQEAIFEGDSTPELFTLSPHLTKVSIIDSQHTRSLYDLENNTLLEELEIASCPNLFDISTIARLTNLRRLTLAYCPEIRKLDVLSSLNHLEYLSLQGSDGIEDIDNLLHIETLQTLDLRECDRVDLSVLVEMAQLNTLIVTSSYLTDSFIQLSALRPGLNIKAEVYRGGR